MEEATDTATVTTNKKNLIIFGRDVAKIPCFRSSWLYGIYSGFGCGILTFMFTSRTPLASHVAIGSTFGVTLVYFSVCRYRFAKDDMMVKQLRVYMKDSMDLEGEDREVKIKQIEELAKTHIK
ncbi:cytochrome c oxidase assembly factor COX20 lethal (3) 87Df [Cotesia typhae]|uniref:cytochrome c oxidase assembly factor COX20 lethal (3) 87Df n=1 Tax=Cotesia typhae TaxID=2053667 RepID=UPI003D6803BB